MNGTTPAATEPALEEPAAPAATAARAVPVEMQVEVNFQIF